MFLRIAIRNVFRNKRRTAFSLGIIVIGVAILYFVTGFVSASLASIQTALVSELGAVQVADRRAFEETAEGYEYLISTETLERLIGLLEGDPRVRGYTWQLGFAGLIGNERGSTLLLARGLVPGNAVEDYRELVIQGRPLAAEGGPQVVIGQELAEKLGVQVGELINIATGTVSGNFIAASAEIVGTFRYNNATLEGQLGFMPLTFAQKLLRTSGVERVLISLVRLEQAEEFSRELQARLDEAGLALEARPWQRLSSFYDSIRVFWVAFTLWTNGGVFALVFFSVLEVLTMAFLERLREVGTIRAVGTKRRQVFKMFLFEGLALGLLGGVLGALAGAGLGTLFNGAGINWTPPGAIEPQPLRVQVGLAVALVPFLTALGSTLLSAIYPAWRGARSSIVQALSHV